MTRRGYKPYRYYTREQKIAYRNRLWWEKYDRKEAKDEEVRRRNPNMGWTWSKDNNWEDWGHS